MTTEDFNIFTYRRHLGEGKLMASTCNRCDALYLPPRPICSACHVREMTWAQLEGEGTILGFTSITVVPTGMAARGYGRENPYISALVALKEGPCVAARIMADDPKHAGRSVHVGIPVTADFVEETVEGGMRPTLVFRPA